MGKHQGTHQLRAGPQAAAHDAGTTALQGLQQSGLTLLPAVLPVQDHVHRLGHRLGDHRVEPLLHSDLQQPYAAAQSCFGRHDAGSGHPPAATHQKQLALVPFVGLGVRLRQPLPGKVLVREGQTSLGALHQRGGHSHLGYHRLPTELLGRIGHIGRFQTGESHRDVRPESSGADPSGIALHTAGQVGGEFQTGQTCGKPQQPARCPGELSPEAESEHAIHHHVRSFQRCADRLFLLPGEDCHLRRHGLISRPGQVGTGLPLDQHHGAVHPPPAQPSGTDKAVPAVVPPATQHHRGLAGYWTAAALRLVCHSGSRVFHQQGKGCPRSHGCHLQTLHFVSAKELHDILLLDRRITL